MKIRQELEEVPGAWGGATNPSTRNFNASLWDFGFYPSKRAFSHAKARTRLDSCVHAVVNLRRILESIPCSAVIEERNRLAREIHDTLVQEFAGILLHLEAANGLELTVNASECLARARELAKSGLEDARRMLMALRPKSLEGTDLSNALGQLAERFSHDCGINCSFSTTGRRHRLAEETENELYRVAQEALWNVRKHSRASSVSILLSYTSAGVILSIKDNGQGFVIKQSQPGAHGFGLPGMCERASRLGGRMDINSGQGAGTEIRIRVPCASKPQRKGTTNERKFNTDGLQGPIQNPASGGG